MRLKENKRIITLVALLFIILILGCDRSVKQTHKGVKVVFPEISKPVQITDNSGDYMFASYHGINSWNKSQRYVTVLKIGLKNTLPGPDDHAILGLVDLENENTFIPLAETRAWNFQQGNMTHWLGTSPDSLIIYNDCRNGTYVSVILNVHTKEEIKVIPYPVSAVSPNGKEAISINFSRVGVARPHYGYAGEGQNPKHDIPFPEDDGMFLVDLESGQAKLIVSFEDIKDQVPEVKEGGMEYIDHTVFSREGSKVLFLARSIPQRNTTAFTVHRDGSNLQRCFPDGWGGSHYDWLSDDELMICAMYEGIQYSHILFTIGKQNYRRLGNGLLDYDGHCTFSPNGLWMMTDTYPEGGFNDQKIYLMDMETEAVLSLGRFPHSQEHLSFGTRCDIHIRWSPKGDMFGFNSTHTGSRQAFICKVN